MDSSRQARSAALAGPSGNERNREKELAHEVPEEDRVPAPLPGGGGRRFHGRGEEALRENCWRYDKMCGTLGSAGGDLDWPESMALLKGCEQEGTTWSVVFSPEGPELWFSVHKEWDSVYHLAMP